MRYYVSPIKLAKIKTKQNWRYPMWPPRLLEEQIRPLDRGMMWYLARLKASVSMT